MSSLCGQVDSLIVWPGQETVCALVLVDGVPVPGGFVIAPGGSITLDGVKISPRMLVSVIQDCGKLAVTLHLLADRYGVVRVRDADFVTE